MAANLAIVVIRSSCVMLVMETFRSPTTMGTRGGRFGSGIIT